MTQRVPPSDGFDHPWQAQLFAVTVALNEAGHFTWAEWADAFGAMLARHGAGAALDGGEDYYAAWLETLEQVLERRHLVPAGEIREMRDAWERAFLRTPHGQPVRLG